METAFHVPAHHPACAVVGSTSLWPFFFLLKLTFPMGNSNGSFHFIPVKKK